MYSSLDFSSGSPGDTLSTSGVIKTIGNVDYKIRVKATAPTADGHTIDVANLRINTENNQTTAQILTNEWADWINCTRNKTTGDTAGTIAVTSTTAYWWINIPSPCYPGTYSFTYYHELAQQ